jgi:hypothetical protein
VDLLSQVGANYTPAFALMGHTAAGRRSVIIAKARVSTWASAAVG